MHYRHRNPGNERRRSSRSIRRYRDARDEFNRRQEAVFKKAGKLAADYLVSIGMLPKSSLRPKRGRNERFDEFNWSERSCRRSDGDGYDDDRRRKRRRSGERRWRRRDWEHGGFRGEDGRRRPRDGRRPRGDDDAGGLDLENRDLGLNNAVGGERGVVNLEGRDDETMSYESGEVRDDDFGVATLEIEGGGGGGGENGVDLLLGCRFVGVPTKPRTKRRRVDGSSSDDMKPLSKHAIDLNKAPSDGDLVSDGEAKMDTSGDLEGKSLCNEFDVAKSDLLKLCRFKNVPTKPRTSFRRRSSKTTMVAKIVEIVSEISKAIEGAELAIGVASNSQLNQSNISDGKELSNSSIIPTKHVVDSVHQGNKLTQSPTNFESSSLKVNVHEEIILSGHPLKPELFEVLPVDEEMIKEHVLDQVKPVDDDFSQKIETELNIKIKMEVEEQLQPTLFKVCDLNLMAPPEIPSEIIEVQDDPISDHLHSKEIPMGFDLMPGNTSITTNGYFLLSGDKMIPVIDLEDDSSIESNDYDSPKPKSENMHSGLSIHTDNGDPHASHGGSSPATSELHQTDTFGGSLAPSDLNSPVT